MILLENFKSRIYCVKLGTFEVSTQNIWIIFLYNVFILIKKNLLMRVSILCNDCWQTVVIVQYLSLCPCMVGVINMMSQLAWSILKRIKIVKYSLNSLKGGNAPCYWLCSLLVKMTRIFTCIKCLDRCGVTMNSEYRYANTLT